MEAYYQYSIFNRFLPESIPWLVVNNRVDQAEEVLKKAAKFNGITLPDKFLEKPASDHMLKVRISFCPLPMFISKSILVTEWPLQEKSDLITIPYDTTPNYCMTERKCKLYWQWI